MSTWKLTSTVAGRARGMAMTRRDLDRLWRVARWYSLTEDQLARMEVGWEAWWIMVHNDRLPKGADLTPMPDGTPGRKASHYLSNLRRRMSLMAGLHVPGHSEGLVTRLTAWEPDSMASGWWLTRAGRDYLDAPYKIATEPSTLKAQHTWDAADLGWQLENAFGLTVLSERETTSGQTFRDGETTEVPVSLFQAKRTAGEFGGRSKRPDLAILHEQGPTLTFTAVEVERTRSRPLRDYREKLLTYMDAPEVDAVWYLCDRASIRNRVRQAMEDLIAAGEVVDPNLTPLLVETSQHWGAEDGPHKDHILRRRTGWVGLPGIGLNGTVLPNSKGTPSAVGTRMMNAITTEQKAQGVQEGTAAA